MMTAETQPFVTVSRHFNAAPERVFDAWLEPQNFSRWLFADPGNDKSYVAEVDARVGGAYTVTAIRADDSRWFATGEYIEIDRPSHLAFTFGMPEESLGFCRITVEIVPGEAGCTLTLTQSDGPEGGEEAVRNGWGGMFEGLAAMLD